MKTNFTKLKTSALVAFLALFLSVSLYAQPANDDCVDAFPVTIGVDEASCIPVDGTTVDGTPSTTPANVCSGSWFSDDIWFSFTTDAVVPVDGYTIMAMYGTETGDVIQAGMGLYESCDLDADPLVCFSDDPGRVTIVNDCDYMPSHTYYVRIWSAPGASDNSGTLRLCVFNSPPPPPPPIDNDVILWGSGPGEGDFDGGLNSWTVINDAACGDTFNLWRWNPAAAATGNSCGNAISASPSHCNGAMVFNSDAYDNPDGGPCGGGGGPCAAPQTGELISPSIDLSQFSGIVGVSVKFWQTTRQFQSTYFVSYSNDDGANWFDKEINDELAVNTGSTDGFKKVFLANADLNSTTFRIKFRYEANYYYWIVDDVRLIEAEANNLQVAPNNFYAIAPNLVTPVSQVEPFSHLADIKNAGAIEQTNVNLNVTIVDDATSNVVFTDDLAYGAIGADSLAENVGFPNYFTPDGVTPTSYTATYEITSDSMDFDITDNTQVYTFMTSDTVFAKEDGGTGTFNPAGTNWDAAEEHSAAYGNYFYIVDGDNWDASSVTFSIGAPDSVMFERLLSIYLYRWDINDMEDGEAMDPAERTKIAFAIYEITGNETINDLINVPLSVFPTSEPGPIDIESNTHYAAMVEYATNDQVDFRMGESTARDYNAQIFRSEQDSIPLGFARYGPLVGLSHPLEDEPYGTTGFGRNQIPVVRLNIAFIVDTEDQLDAVNILEISPNPTSNKINVNIDLVEAQEKVNIRIFDMSGRVLIDQYYNNFQAEQLEFDVSQFANGAYFLHFISEEGMRAERFIVQH